MTALDQFRRKVIQPLSSVCRHPHQARTMAPFFRRHQQLPTKEGRGYRRSIEAFANFIFPGRRGDVVIPTFPFSLAITCNVPDDLVCGTLLPRGHEPGHAVSRNKGSNSFDPVCDFSRLNPTACLKPVAKATCCGLDGYPGLPGQYSG